jgi:hypothetical protein
MGSLGAIVSYGRMGIYELFGYDDDVMGLDRLDRTVEAHNGDFLVSNGRGDGC